MGNKCIIKNNKNHPLQDRDWLYDQYINLNKTQLEIAIFCKCSKASVEKWLRINNICKEKLITEKLESIEKSYLYKDYNWMWTQYIENKKSTSEIGILCVCPTHRIYKWLLKLDIPIRSISESKIYKPNIGKRGDDCIFRRPDIQMKSMEARRARNFDWVKGNNSSSKRPEVRAKMSASHKGMIFTEEHRKNISKNSGMKNSEEARHKSSISHSGERSHAWRGGLSQNKYCYKFNNSFKEYVRKSFNRQCYICNKSEIENGKHLFVHHIDYNKNSICKGKAWAFVPLCAACHSKTNFHRYYWFNLLINYWLNNSEILLWLPGDIYYNNR